MNNNNELQSLRIKELDLYSFRNYLKLNLSSLDNLSIFVGENAVGKTSIIEAIQLMSDLKSFRTNQSAQLVTWDQDEAQICVQISDGVRQLKEELKIIEGKRQYFLNNKKKRIQDLKGLLPAVVFTPDDLTLIKGSNTKRRDSLDNLGVQLSQNFYKVRSDYLKVLKQKNKALKEEAPNEVVQSLNDVLAKVGTQYIIHRHTLITAFLPRFKQAFQYITQKKEDANISYDLSWEESLNIQGETPDKAHLFNYFQEAIENAFNEEKISHRSIIGPHADKINFYIGTCEQNPVFRNAQAYASQGQQRTLVLAFKMAELETIQDILHQKPVLLLDDVMSELDEKRRNMFMNLVVGDIQTFITTTNLNYFNEEVLEKADIYQLPFKD